MVKNKNTVVLNDYIVFFSRNTMEHVKKKKNWYYKGIVC